MAWCCCVHVCVYTGAELSVLPRFPVAGASKWLLKMHGCVSEPEDIVLTRRDYIRYSENRYYALDDGCTSPVKWGTVGG